MQHTRCYAFPPFHLDVADERLFEDGAPVRLGGKALAVLRCLVSEPGRLVTKDQLLARAWPATAVSEAVLTTAMRELRRALRDDARAPRFVETVHGRGYRFIAPVMASEAPPRAAAGPAAGAATIARAASPAFPGFVGRARELDRMRDWCAEAHRGRRRIGFVAGEAGIGKSALVEALLAGLAADGGVLIARGQCVEQYGAGEAYLPILEALGRLGRERRAAVKTVLEACAPSWLAHLPAVAGDAPPRAAPRVTPERMLRELADALEALAGPETLVLVLEDLHWSDTATLEALAYVARRADPARLLVIASYRPIEALAPAHPARSAIGELRQRAPCEELRLDYLQVEDVERYVLDRCGADAPWRELAALLHRRTAGHPLLLAAIVTDLLRAGRGSAGAGAPSAAALDLDALARSVPTSVRQFIEHRFTELAAGDQAILAAASVAGEAFSVAAVAAAAGEAEERVDARCAAWARHGPFLTAEGTARWPDGTIAARYRFRHALFQEVIYAGVPAGRRAALHRAIGTRLEQGHGSRADQLSAELAVHFEQGGMPRAAVPHREHAARVALGRSAYVEARRHLVRGLELAGELPEGRERLARELELSLLLGKVLESTTGWATGEVERIYARARELAAHLDDPVRLAHALWGLFVVAFVRADIRGSWTLAEELLGRAMARGDRALELLAHMELAGVAFMLGRPAVASRHFADAARLEGPHAHDELVARFGMDAGLFSRAWEAHFLWHAGRPDQARARSDEALAAASARAHPFTLAIVLAYAAMLAQFRREVDRVRSLAEATAAHCRAHGFPYYLAWAELLRGWSRAMQGAAPEGIAEIRRGIEVLSATAGVRLPYYRALLAEACTAGGLIEEGLAAVSGALADVERTDERWWEAELHRLRGELLRAAAPRHAGEADACFTAAIAIAERQEARSLELRALTSLVRLRQAQPGGVALRKRLAALHAAFGEGQDTADLREAASLLGRRAGTTGAEAL